MESNSTPEIEPTIFDTRREWLLSEINRIARLANEVELELIHRIAKRLISTE